MKFKYFKESLKLNLFGIAKIPLIVFCTPSVVKLDDENCEIKIPLRYRTKNHLGSMYFGALAIGGDLASGLAAMFAIDKSEKKISLVFKDFKANFLKRPTEDVIFRCQSVKETNELVKEAESTTERVERPIEVVAIGAKSGDLYAEMTLTLSLKQR
ncbi:MAG: PaaI family thioesterase [Bdellovibrionales bacterium]